MLILYSGLFVQSYTNKLDIPTRSHYTNTSSDRLLRSQHSRATGVCLLWVWSRGLHFLFQLWCVWSVSVQGRVRYTQLQDLWGVSCWAILRGWEVCPLVYTPLLLILAYLTLFYETVQCSQLTPLVYFICCLILLYLDRFYRVTFNMKPSCKIPLWFITHKPFKVDVIVHKPSPYELVFLFWRFLLLFELL